MKKFSEHVVQVLREEADGDFVSRLQIIEVDGIGRAVEKRQYVRGSAGQLIPGPFIAWDEEDRRLALDRGDEICAVLEGKSEA